MKSISIIICTYNRASHLKLTLQALGTLDIPTGIGAELLIVDNGSNDNTAEIARNCHLPNMQTRYLYEGKIGQCHARNTGMAIASGDILLWTDDDVRPPHNWVKSMCQPIINGQAQGVAGGVSIAPHLERSWMQRTHYIRLADTRFRPEHDNSLIGANMAFHKCVLEKVPCFDIELGPGAFGFRDETLFSSQLIEAGFIVTTQHKTVVEHHFDETRLERRAWLRNSEANAKSSAYVLYHWSHENVQALRTKMLAWKLALQLFRIAYPPKAGETEGCDRREIRIVQNIAFYKQFLMEARKPRNYDFKGLVKKR